jgi:hypothetical protein
MHRRPTASIILLLVACARSGPSPVDAATPGSPRSTDPATQSEGANARPPWLAPSDMIAQPTSMEGFPHPVCNHTAVWTGEAVLVWGGDEAFPKEDDGYRPVDPIGRADGGIYDPVADTWRPLPSAPLAGRFDHVAVWTGAEMLVFGGRDANTAFGDGAAFDPKTGTWRPLARAGAPSGRSSPGATWTGRELVVVGGRGFGGEARHDAFAYDPAADAWRPLGTLTPRDAPTAAWTGAQIVVWGGVGPTAAVKGERLVEGAWRPLPTRGAPPVRPQQLVICAGTQLVVWGGLDADDAPTKDGARWDPTTDAWTPMSTKNAHARRVEGAVFTGDVVAVLGEIPEALDLDVHPGTLGLYNPKLDRWWSLAGPFVSEGMALTWTGRELVAWGGFDGTNMSPTGDRVRLR